MKKVCRSLLYVFAVIFLYCCVDGEHLQNKDETPVDSLAERWSGYNWNGMYDSLIISARSSFYDARSVGDSVVALYSASVLAQSFLFGDETDSIMYYIDLARPYYDALGDVGPARIIYNNALASYYLRTDLDYSNALLYYLRGLDCAEEENSIYNQIVLLANITDIFYMIGDGQGGKYAERAYRLSQEEGADAFTRCIASVSKAQMLCLSQQYDSASMFIDSALRLSDTVDMESLTTIIGTVCAEIAEARGDIEDAGAYYRQALHFRAYTDPGTVSMTYLRYGEFLERNGMLPEALEQYRAGLDVSYRSSNMKFRNQLMQSAAEVSYRLGHEKDALSYLLNDNGYVGRVSMERERDFNTLLLSNQEMAYEKSLLERELALMETDRKLSNAVLVVTIVLTLSLMLVILYVRQRRMYRKLVEQYRMFSSRLEHADSIASTETGGAVSDSNDDMYRELFLKADRAMRTEKIFKQKNISMDSLAAQLGTNRTYLSKAINTYSGMTMYRYLDMWRIKEAVRIITESHSRVLLKQLSDDLGYSSPSVFYKAFKRETGCLPSQFIRESATARAGQSPQH